MRSFCQKCPRKLKSPPDEPCHLALENIYWKQTETSRTGPEPGCPWSINSAEHNYCFWSYARLLHGDPKTDKEICSLLMLKPRELAEITESIKQKLISAKDSKEIVDWKQAIIDYANSLADDKTIYMPDNFADITPPETSDTSDAADDSKKKKVRRNLSMPLHRDGKKTDIYGLYSKKKYADKKK